MKPVRIRANGCAIIAHRGLSGIERENTIAAFVAAGNRDYFGIETDIWKHKSGRFLVMHDPHTGRVAGKKLSIRRSCFRRLRRLRLFDREGGERSDLSVPTLEEYLRVCKRYEKKCVLEFKEAFPEKDVKAILSIIEKEYALDRIIFISFHASPLKILRRLSEKAEIQLLFSGEVTEKLLSELKENRFDLDLSRKDLKKEDVLLLHENGVKLNVWTVDDPQEAEKFISWGADFLTTNILEG